LIGECRLFECSRTPEFGGLRNRSRFLRFDLTEQHRLLTCSRGSNLVGIGKHLRLTRLGVDYTLEPIHQGFGFLP